MLTSDNKGGGDAWLAGVIRSEADPPSLGEWRRAKPGGIFGLMLHAAVIVEAEKHSHGRCRIEQTSSFSARPEKRDPLTS